MASNKPALIALEDGSVFHGNAFGAARTVVGEAVFNTSMTGYQEILTDPSYYTQIITMTTPQIGNYGINPQDEESDGPKALGFVVRDISPVTSNWRSRESVDSYLTRHDIPGISGVDTRSITKKLRVTGAMKACLSTEDISAEDAVAKARDWPGLIGVDFVKDVTCSEPFHFDPDGTESQPFSVPGTRLIPEDPNRAHYRVVAYDFGAKRNIFRKLRYHGFDVWVVPANTPAEQVHELKPDGIFLSNGPGDPAALPYAHKAIGQLLNHYPMFGICMGHQIITHALGASTFKLKFGHRGGNQPVKNLETETVLITSQNHGFASDPKAIEARGGIVTEINLNDQTVEGLRHKELPVFSVQYHPEAAPGPNDADNLFKQFHNIIKKHKG